MVPTTFFQLLREGQRLRWAKESSKANINIISEPQCGATRVGKDSLLSKCKDESLPKTVRLSAFLKI